MPGLWDLDPMWNATAEIRHRLVGIDANGERSMIDDGTTVCRAYAEPRTSSEDLAGVTTEHTAWLVVLPGFVRVGAHDQIVMDAAVHGIVGPPRPYRWPDATGSGIHHWEIDTAVVTG